MLKGLFLALVFTFGVFVWCSDSVISLAAGTAKVVAGSGKIRESADTGSKTIASVKKDDKLELITRDESAVWPPYKDAKDMTKEELDDLRFVRNNNEILRCIGYDMDASHIQTLIIPNNSYDRLILLSDGVTDLLSQENIRVISRNYPIDQITHELVEAAINNIARRAKGADDMHLSGVPAGKDNATAAMYARR